MRMQHGVVVATLAGVLAFTPAPRAHAMDPYYQDLLSNLMYGLVLGSPYGSYGTSPHDPYRSSTYDPYRTPPYDPYGNLPHPDPHRFDDCGCYVPMRSSSPPRPYDHYQDRDNRYRYQERLDRLDRKYAKAMNRLDRQEAEARAKAYRKSHGDPVRYHEKLAKIERKYDHKRHKVERNTAQGYRKLSGRY